MKIVSDSTLVKRTIQISDGSDRTGSIFFENGKFSQCIYSMRRGVQQGTYTLSDWSFLGELSNFIQDIQNDENKKESQTV